MSLQFNGMHYAFFVKRVLNQTFNSNDNGLLHLVAYDFTSTRNT